MKNMLKYICWPLFAAGIMQASAADDTNEIRTWTDAQGKRIDASLERVSEDRSSVVLVINGMRSVVPMERLSDEDIEYIKNKFPKPKPNPSRELRRWSYNTGGGVEASLAEVADNGGKVRLRRRDGLYFDIPISSLSKDDIAYCKGQGWDISQDERDFRMWYDQGKIGSLYLAFHGIDEKDVLLSTRDGGVLPAQIYRLTDDDKEHVVSKVTEIERVNWIRLEEGWKKRHLEVLRLFDFHTEESDVSKASSQHEAQARAMTLLAVRNLEGSDRPKDLKRGIELLEKAAALGYADAMYQLGLCYSSRKDIEVDRGRALDWFVRAAHGGNALSYRQLSSIYQTAAHNENPHDTTLAYALFLRAAELGCEDAVRNLDAETENRQQRYLAPRLREQAFERVRQEFAPDLDIKLRAYLNQKEASL